LKSIEDELSTKSKETPPSQNQEPTAVVQMDRQFVGFDDIAYHF